MQLSGRIYVTAHSITVYTPVGSKTISNVILVNKNMAACAFATRLLASVRRRVSSSRASTLRGVSCVAARYQLHGGDRAAALAGEVDRFGGVTVNLGRIGLPADISESSFSRLLQGGTGVKAPETMRFKRRSVWDLNK